MNVCALLCTTCDVELTVARHEDDCADPGSHGLLKLLGDAHAAAVPEHTLEIRSETEAVYTARLATEADERAAAARHELEQAELRAVADRERMGRLAARVDETSAALAAEPTGEATP